jgi:hypothetical protein
MAKPIAEQALVHRNRINELDAEIDSLLKTRKRIAEAYAALTGDEETFAVPRPPGRWNRRRSFHPARPSWTHPGTSNGEII